MNIKQQILLHEGFRPTPERVGRSLVVGIGYNLTTRGTDHLSAVLGRQVDASSIRLTENEAWKILEADVTRAELVLNTVHQGLKPLDPVRWRAALELALQAGVDAMRFAEAAKALGQRDWTGAAKAIHRAVPGPTGAALAHMVLTGQEPVQGPPGAPVAAQGGTPVAVSPVKSGSIPEKGSL